MQFNEYEKDIMDYLKRYEDSTLNEVKPFDKLNPTVENFAEVVFNDLRYHSKLIENKIILQKLEVSEGPTRTYIIVNDDI
ncbi:6-carboxytetrahydropterin synthase [Weissella koreensis]|uniref:6-carboxytetrahydropterin synthase n=1 Tax=Weissella koreensis TaxID=165096 RepID=UPI00241F8299|nr:6-carboxytetrahydropterin synthase [Weissella koreensis]